MDHSTDTDEPTLNQMIEYIKDPRFSDLTIHDLLSEMMIKHRDNLKPIYPALHALMDFRPELGESLRQAIRDELELRQNPQ
jgi:hypothetical protein